MEEACDASGSCSQNGQTFKGIWWLHFTVFCQPIEADGNDGGGGGGNQRDREEAALLHRASCRSYGDWVQWNAKAAWATRDRERKFGEWWGAHRWWPEPVGDQGTDYRNEGVPHDELWRGLRGGGDDSPGYHDHAAYAPRPPLPSSKDGKQDPKTYDPNTRGRGRTVETQSGGLAVVRALYAWEMWYGQS